MSLKKSDGVLEWGKYKVIEGLEVDLHKVVDALVGLIDEFQLDCPDLECRHVAIGVKPSWATSKYIVKRVIDEHGFDFDTFYVVTLVVDNNPEEKPWVDKKLNYVDG